METVLLTQREVTDLISMEEAVNSVEEAFKLHAIGKAQMPPKVYLTFESGDLRAMPAQLMGYAALKWVNSHPGNPEKGLPTVMAVLILNDPATGFPLAIMDATYLTSLRTGAAGGVAAKYLARKDSKILGFVGCGTQAYFQLEALLHVREADEVRAFDISSKAAERFANYCSRVGVDCDIVDARKACMCDILVTSTPSTKPVVKSEWVEAGTHINAIGADAPGKQELEIDLLKRAKIVVDDMEQALHGGEINVAVARGELGKEDIHATLGEVVAGLKPGRENQEEITIFDSTGLAIQDVAVAKIVYENAVARDVGMRVRLFEI